MFLDTNALSEFIESSKLEMLINIREAAFKAGLSSKYLYKGFNGLHVKGNLNLLKQPTIAIIGTRHPNQYSRQICATLSSSLSNSGFSIISGGAIGIDYIAHENSTNNILVSPAGLNRIYPKENAKIFEKAINGGLLLSEYGLDSMPYHHTFLERNRIIITLSDIVIIPQADLKSGSTSSANLSIALNKELYVLPHRINESLGTQELLAKGVARAIYDINGFIASVSERFGTSNKKGIDDPLLDFASKQGQFSKALELFGSKVYEYELEGKIKRVGLYISLCD